MTDTITETGIAAPPRKRGRPTGTPEAKRAARELAATYRKVAKQKAQEHREKKKMEKVLRRELTDEEKITKSLVKKDKQRWRINPKTFAAIHKEYKFTVDAFSDDDGANSMLHRYLCPSNSALACDWQGERVWANPPYADLYGVMAHAWAQVAHGECELAVVLLPVRTDRDWFEKYAWQATEITFFIGRLNFTTPRSTPLKTSSNIFENMLVVFQRGKIGTSEDPNSETLAPKFSFRDAKTGERRATVELVKHPIRFEKSSRFDAFACNVLEQEVKDTLITSQSSPELAQVVEVPAFVKVIPPDIEVALQAAVTSATTPANVVPVTPCKFCGIADNATSFIHSEMLGGFLHAECDDKFQQEFFALPAGLREQVLAQVRAQ